MITCIILHNLIVEDQRGESQQVYEYDSAPVRRARRRAHEIEIPDLPIVITHTDPEDLPDHSIGSVISRTKQTRDVDTHFNLKRDLIAHIWANKGTHID